MRKKLLDLIYGNKGTIEERLFALVVTAMSVTLFFFLIVDALTGAPLGDILLVALFLVLLDAVALFAYRKKRLKAGGIVISALMIFALLPFTFFSDGGIYGGPPIWFIFAALFVSLILSGKLRIFFLISDLVVAGICYTISFDRPELVKQNTTPVAYIDSYAAVAFISAALCVIVAYEIMLYRRENTQAERQRQEIEALNASQNRFFSSMSHEIRTPINTIIGLNEMILREDVSEEVAEDAANIQAASKMLLHLINDILDMSKLESGSMQLTPVAYKVGDMLSELVGMFWGRAKEKGLDFTVSVAPDVPAELFGDDVRIKQILINVLNNAVKYTREGSVSLSIQCGTREGGTQKIIYSISDTGIGIKKENIPYLFTAFKRVDEEKNHRIEGTGLGLSIVKQLVDLMGGTVTVNSVYTQGSTFVIELPQQPLGDETVGDLETETKHDLHRAAYNARFEAPEASVLVVDDSASNLMVVTKLLRETKVQVETASSGEEALRKTQEKHYHIILMDHLMPEMDGLECHKRILSQPGGMCKESKVIALTANADSESRALYEREGFDGYLTKPLDSKTLESELYHQLPENLVHVLAVDDEDLQKSSLEWIQAPQHKRLVAVATESVADLPREILEKYDIATIPHLVVTDNGVFRDSLDLESNGLLSYMSDPAHKAETAIPDVADFENFFADQLKRANHVIFIALSGKVGNSACAAAKEAAASFNNVTVIDSGHLSSGQGLMVMEACRLAEEGKTPAEIEAFLADDKNFVQTSFIVDSLDYLARAGQVGSAVANVTKSLVLHPVLVMRNGKMTVGKLLFGSRRRVWRRYIASRLRMPADIDTGTLFITYTGASRQELSWIKEQVEARVHFDNVYFQKASAAISVNCGPGSFGLLFRRTVL